jgi:anion-transporting  ArsA/GET3 family ATPase
VSTRDTDWDGVRLHVVTGKGGTGKTTVAGALALALAAGGKRVLLMEMEGRQGIAQLFDVPPLPYEERKVAVAPASMNRAGGDVYALVADPESALVEYLEMFYNLRHAGAALTKLGIMDFATTVAPGLRDVLLTGKAAEAVRRKSSGKTGGRVYDAVVMDAPPTGRIGRFLNVTSEVSGLARVGPIRGHADTVQKVIRSPDTAVHFVTVLEEMPVQETLDGIAELASLPGGGIQIGGIIINMTRPLALPAEQVRAAADGELDEDELALGLKTAGLEDSRGLAAQLAVELAEDATSGSTRRDSRVTSCRGLVTASTSAGFTGSPPRSGSREPRNGQCPQAARARRRPPDRRPADAHPRLLRLRRGGQDHDSGGHRAARR